MSKEGEENLAEEMWVMKGNRLTVLSTVNGIVACLAIVPRASPNG